MRRRSERPSWYIFLFEVNSARFSSIALIQGVYLLVAAAGERCLMVFVTVFKIELEKYRETLKPYIFLTAYKVNRARKIAQIELEYNKFVFFCIRKNVSRSR